MSSLKTSFEALKNKDTLLNKSVVRQTNRARGRDSRKQMPTAGIYNIKVNDGSSLNMNELKDNKVLLPRLSQTLSASNFTITIKVTSCQCLWNRCGGDRTVLHKGL